MNASFGFEKEKKRKTDNIKIIMWISIKTSSEMSARLTGV